MDPGHARRKQRADALRALEHAHRIRAARAQLRHRIGEGAVSVAEIILDPPAEAIRWAVIEVLLSQRHWGRVKSRKLLVRNNISELKPLGALTDRQRRLLAAQLSARADDD